MAFDTLKSAAEEASSLTFPFALAKDNGAEYSIAFIVGDTYNEWYTYDKDATTAINAPLVIEAKGGRWVRTTASTTATSDDLTLLALQSVHATLQGWDTVHDVQGRYILSSKGEILKTA